MSTQPHYDTTDATTPTPRDGSTVISVAVEGVPLTWIGAPQGMPGPGELAGDGSPTSRALIRRARELWENPIEVDHPSWVHPLYTTNATHAGVLATLLHLGGGRAIILDAPPAVTEDVFMDDDAAAIEDPQAPTEPTS